MLQDVIALIPNLHALTGCDSSSALSGHGKKSILKLAQSHLTLVSRLNDNFEIDPTTVSEEASEVCVELASLIYTGKESNVDLAKMQNNLFEKKQLVTDKLPPTFPEYHEHIKEANFHAHIWNNATVPMLNLPSPIENGWSRDEEDSMCPTKMLNPPAHEGFVELTICRCETTCGMNRCSCERNGFLYSGACYCETCENNVEEYSDSEESEMDYTDN